MKTRRAVRARETFTRLSPSERRAQIIEVASALFGTQTYDELTIGSVAQAAGVTQGLIDHYFPNKEALFVEAFTEGAKNLLTLSLPDTTLPLLEQVARGTKGYLDFVESHAIAYRNLFRVATPTEPEFLRICEQTRRHIVEHFIAILGVGEQAMPATRVSLRGYVGYVECIILEWLDTRSVPRETLERLIFSALCSALLSGLASDRVVPGLIGSLAVFEVAYKRHFELP